VSLAANLDLPADLEVVRALAAEADVLVENFRPGALERRGRGAERFLADRPEGVWCSSSGFGPESQRPGYDLERLQRDSREPRLTERRSLLRAHPNRRPLNVATRSAVNGVTGTLSGKRNPRYSIVVRTTEPEQLVDQDDSDQRIIQRVLAGDRDDFTVLITRYSDPLYRHALCMTGSPDVAEDILQLSFIKAYQHLAEVRGRFDAWVFRIVANGCKDWLKNIRRSHLSYDEDDQPSSYATPEEELDRTELRSDLDVALSSLPASLREAFVMKHVEGRSYEEMADLLGTTVGALKMRVHRAREALQALLEEKYA
jgi:RNA polymerase sigma-70 factor (ECF subfamily)